MEDLEDDVVTQARAEARQRRMMGDTSPIMVAVDALGRPAAEQLYGPDLVHRALQLASGARSSRMAYGRREEAAMSESTTPSERPAVDGPELSGVGLARVALHAARGAARKRGQSEARAPRRRRDRTVRRDGREPSGFASVLQGLMAERAWNLPAAGGSVLDRWPDIAAAIASQLPDRVQAVAFHAEPGQLDLRPASPAYATQLRLITARIVAAVNEAVGTDVVRAVRVLPVGAAAVSRTAPGAPALPPDALQAPVKTREMASPGFHRALAAHQAVAPGRTVDPSIAQALERQTRAMRGLSRRAFPEPEVSAAGSVDVPDLGDVAPWNGSGGGTLRSPVWREAFRDADREARSGVGRDGVGENATAPGV
ncbi:DciA family protein [Streptomyces sp. NRRL B-1347]|uniref:DciA family protein n=1 Tax=Streptomyces sp. NRRL B-1347 TaxID=1476877 RepID=UPI001F1C8E2A|nr:DciA family protein [Streptomyces sp. NRRL B-1347]